MFIRTDLDGAEGFMVRDVGVRVEDLALALARHPKVGLLAEAIAAHGVREDLEVDETMRTSDVFRALKAQVVEHFRMEAVAHEVEQELVRKLGHAVEVSMENLQGVRAPKM